MKVLSFNFKYFMLAALLFIIEVIIALFFDDAFIRPYFGDFLVAILMYCFVRSFVGCSKVSTAIGVLFFSYLVELSQYFELVKLMGLQHSKLANIICGTTFSWSDIYAYSLGITVVIIAEFIRAKRNYVFSEKHIKPN